MNNKKFFKTKKIIDNESDAGTLEPDETLVCDQLCCRCAESKRDLENIHREKSLVLSYSPLCYRYVHKNLITMGFPMLYNVLSTCYRNVVGCLVSFQ